MLPQLFPRTEVNLIYVGNVIEIISPLANGTRLVVEVEVNLIVYVDVPPLVVFELISVNGGIAPAVAIVK